MIVYEPVLKEESFFASKVMRNLDEFKKLSDVVVANRITIVASKPIKKGEMLSEENLAIKRPGNGISPMRWDEIIGTVATKDYSIDELI